MKVLTRWLPTAMVTLLCAYLLTPLHAQCDATDWQALQALYLGTDGENWTTNTGWHAVDPTLHPTPPAGCDLTTLHGVTGIDLSANNLTGLLPAALGDLAELTALDLSNNLISGNIPITYAQLSQLTTLDLSNNALSGCYDAALATSSGSAGNPNDALLPGGTTYARPDGSTLTVTDFDPLRDKIAVGGLSIHTQIMYEGPTGLTFQHMFNQSSALILEGIFLRDLRWFNFDPIQDAHFQQDISAVLAYENCTGLSRPNTVYVRSHQAGLVETVTFDPATDKISFFYLNVRGDEGTNFLVEDTPQGARFFSPYHGQSLTLDGVSFSQLTPSHFEWRANQLEDNVAGRMDLDLVVANWQIDQNGVFNGKSVPMAGGVDQAPYHVYDSPQYTGTPICTLDGGSGGWCNFTNADISDGNNFDTDWEDFCANGIVNCSGTPPTVSIDSPADNQNFPFHNDVLISTTVTDADGTIASVTMDVEGSPLSVMNMGGGTYTAYWTPHYPATYTLTVTATDNDGFVTTATLTMTGEDDPDTNQAPVAVATATPTSGNAPLDVHFHGTGSYDPDGDAITHLWNFGDGNSATSAIADHVYTTPGTYTATLTVSDGSLTDSESFTITVNGAANQPPVAVANATPTPGTAPLDVHFHGMGSYDPDGDVLTYAWDFGDGNTAMTAMADHTYTSAGVYTATLTVSDGTLSDAATVTITVDAANQAPTAALIATPTTGTAPLNVNFSGTPSSDPDGDALTYVWDFGDGNTATGATTSHVYTAVGGYTATLTVSDGTLTDSETATITVTSGGGGGACAVTLLYRTSDNSSSSATDNQIRPSFRLENDGNTALPLQDIKIRYWYTREGTAQQNAWVDYAQVGNGNVTTNFVQMSNPVAGADHYFEVGFTAGAGSIAPNGSSGPISTRFAKVGWSKYDETNDHSYSAAHSNFLAWENVTVYCNGVLAWGTEPDGSTGGGGGTSNTAPVAAASATPTSGTAPLTVQFDATGSTDADGDALTYVWDFGDGGTASGAQPSHVYTTAGTYTATVTVSDGNGGTDTESLTITVDPDTGGGGDIEVIFTVNNSWNAGYCATVEIVNHGGTALNGWDLDMDLTGSINNLWNANWTQSGSTLSASNLGWNASIGANGGSRSFGFCAAKSGPISAPTNGTLNGTPVTITYVNTNLASGSGGSNALAVLPGELEIAPNPARDLTMLRYDLPRAGAVRLLLFDQTGRLVRTLVDGAQPPGLHTSEVSTAELVEGVYVVRLVGEEVEVVRRLVVVR